ncbi:hypothetical protein V1512DRAFT_268187 [Lipomyces arxii]|uniref:uncharacterized protein n=1 Tax=Lipomyces arxii TaxID=56418 RepID=UPI0034CFDEDB
MVWIRRTDDDEEKQVQNVQSQRSYFSRETMIESSLLTGGILLCMTVYMRCLRRIPTARDIPSSYYAQTKTIKGRAVFVGDGDNVRIFHTPGGVLAGWNWLRRVPFENHWRRSKNNEGIIRRLVRSWIPSQSKAKARMRLRRDPKRGKKLSEETINVRLSGIDAPEGAHFGNKAQPFSSEAKSWLTDYVLGRNVKVTLYSLDQYQRAVGKITIWKLFGKKDVSLEMLKAGYAFLYEGTESPEASRSQQKYTDQMIKAQKNKKGLWIAGIQAETPAEYKRKTRGIDNSSHEENNKKT